MDYSAALPMDGRNDADVIEQRGAPRYTSLIRAAKMVCGQGEFLCVIRDVSATGISFRTFHALPDDTDLVLELQNGESYPITEVRRDGFEASYRFEKPVEVEKLIHETWKFPKRQLRLNLAIPLTISTLSGKKPATTVNLSQQGARIECDEAFAIDQRLAVTGEGLPETRATVRWRRDAEYGLVFDHTLSLREFAMLAAAVQCPSMLQDQPF